MPYIQLASGEKVEIILPREQADRLTRTCFRGRNCRQAGNFFMWPHFSAFIQDSETQGILMSILGELVEEANVQKRHRIELEYRWDIGWDSVMEIDNLESEDIETGEVRDLNKRATALFLPDDLILAPRTNIVTMVLEQKHVNHWRFIIWTMYPGYDVGDLRGDMTELHGFVWLSWSNPGDEESIE